MNAWTEFRATPAKYIVSDVKLKTLGTRGIIAGGTDGVSSYNSIDYIDISNLSNTSSFGTVNEASCYYMVGCSNGSRGVNSCTYNANMNYLNISTLGVTQNFGTLITSKNKGGSCSNSYRGLVIGSASGNTTIEYITIANLSNSSSFGSLLQKSGTGSEFPTSISNETLSLISKNNKGVDKITINILSNSVTFSSLSVTDCYGRAAGTNDNKCVFALGGSGLSNAIEYCLYSNDSGFVDFGDLTLGRSSLTSCSYNHKVLFCGGWVSSGKTNTIDYITLSQLSNATDFGDISSQSKWCQCGYSGQ